MNKFYSICVMFVFSVLVLSTHAYAESAKSKAELRKKYARVNNFLNTKFPKSKAAPDYWK